MLSERFAEDGSYDLIERRWFAAARAVADMQTECEVLTSVVELAQSARRSAKARLAELEAICNALGNDLMGEGAHGDRKSAA